MIVTEAAWVAARAQVQSLIWDLPYATGMPSPQKKKERNRGCIMDDKGKIVVTPEEKGQGAKSWDLVGGVSLEVLKGKSVSRYAL